MKKTLLIILSAAILFSCFAFPFNAFADEEHLHSLIEVEAIEPTCTEDGVAQHYKCSGCDKLFSDENGENEITAEELIIEKTHKMTYVKAVPETCISDGVGAYYKCSACKKLFIDEKGEEETSLTELFIPMHDHRIRFHSAVTRTFTTDGLTEGAYCGECGCIIVPQRVTAHYGFTKLTKLKKGNKCITATWVKVEDVDGYNIQVSLKKSFKTKKSVTVTKNTTVKKKVRGLKKKRKYYVRVRAYKKINGTKKYSKWSNVKSIKTK